MKFRRNGVQLLQPGSAITSQENFPMRKHASDFNVSTCNGNYPSDCRVINERSVSQAGSRLASPGISRANSRASSPGGGRRVAICEVVRKYSHSTRNII